MCRQVSRPALLLEVLASVPTSALEFTLFICCERVSTSGTVTMSHALARGALALLLASLFLSLPVSAFSSVSVSVWVCSSDFLLPSVSPIVSTSEIEWQLAYRPVSRPRHCRCVAKSVSHCLFYHVRIRLVKRLGSSLCYREGQLFNQCLGLYIAQYVPVSVSFHVW